MRNYRSFVRVLGVDLGSKRIGLAVSDISGTVASPHSVLHRSKSRRHDHSEIARIAREEEVEEIVVGLPLNMDGSHGPAARSAAAEAGDIATVTGMVVHLQDERLTTVTAERALMEGNLGARERRNIVDKVAAAVLLQTWLDGRRGDR